MSLYRQFLRRCGSGWGILRLAGMVLFLGATSVWAQELEDIRQYLALRDELIQVKAFLERSLDDEPGTGSLANPAAELEIKDRLTRLDGEIGRLAKMPGPLAAYYADRLQRLAADCRALFPVFVQRLALSVRQPVATGPTLLSAVPPAPPVTGAAAPTTSPGPGAPAAPAFAMVTTTPTSGAPPSGPSTPSAATASVDGTPPSTGTFAPASGQGLAGPTGQVAAAPETELLRRRREFFHPIGVRTLLDRRLARGGPPGAARRGLPALPPETPPTTVSASMAAGLPLPAPAPSPAPALVAPVATGPIHTITYPTLPPPVDGMPVTIRPLEPWDGPDPQVRETPGMRPLAVMIENHAHARPQTGLDEAEVVYEIPVEGGITRFMALYYHVPGVIGPVRSCREYFIDRAFEVNALYVHCGGSPKGYEYIGKTKIFAIDEISNGGPFFRDSSRKAPHNLYARGKDLIETANKRHPMQLPYQRLPLRYGPHPTVGSVPGRGLAIRYHGNYSVSYRFNPRYNLYDRFMNGVQHLDRVTLRPVSPGTVILQEAAMRVVDDKGRQEITFFGQGKAFILYGGTLIRATWKKDGLRDFTRFFDEQGRPVVFSNKAPVWIQVVSPQNAVAFDPPLVPARMAAASPTAAPPPPAVVAASEAAPVPALLEGPPPGATP